MANKPNRLQNETSQYLRSHASNPVDWYPWGKEALARAKKENKPIFLSIGYSACHWCHVMEKESFENEQIAELMNKNFINIKVDREERQDLDHIYMTAVQLLTGRGGWPMSVFLTPELKPFYGGTYFPPEDRHGMPGFPKILLGVANAWATKPNDVLASSQQLFESLSKVHSSDGVKGDSIPPSLFEESVAKVLKNFDPYYGGFGSAPKFFHTVDMLNVLLHSTRTKDATAESLLKKTWEAWAYGGIYDQLGGGFHRYSTDERWFAPHFEKMLYDNALVTTTFLEAYKVFKSPLYSQIAAQTLDYISREMTSPEGGFYSTEDADSEGVEGKFYVWTKEELENILGSETSEIFAKVYGVTQDGNWEHSNILYLKKPLEQSAKELGIDAHELEDTLAFAKRKLLTERAKRIAPAKDLKVITSWNAMMIDTMAVASVVLANESYLEKAVNAANFLLTRLKNADGLLHSYQEGRSILIAYLDDWATLTSSLTTLFEVTGEEKWLNEAMSLAEEMIARFYDGKGDFYFTEKNQENLIYRPKEAYDGATPSATGVAVTALARLGRILDRKDFLALAEKTLSHYSTQMTQIPSAFAQLLQANEYLTPRCKEVVFIPGEDTEENREVHHLLNSSYLGIRVLVYPNPLLAKSPLLLGKNCIGKKATVYLCENHTCKEPWVGIDDITQRLADFTNP